MLLEFSQQPAALRRAESISPDEFFLKLVLVRFQTTERTCDVRNINLDSAPIHLLIVQPDSPLVRRQKIQTFVKFVFDPNVLAAIDADIPDGLFVILGLLPQLLGRQGA